MKAVCKEGKTKVSLIIFRIWHLKFALFCFNLVFLSSVMLKHCLEMLQASALVSLDCKNLPPVVRPPLDDGTSCFGHLPPVRRGREAAFA